MLLRLGKLVVSFVCIYLRLQMNTNDFLAVIGIIACITYDNHWCNIERYVLSNRSSRPIDHLLLSTAY